MPGRGTSDAIFILWQVHGKSLSKYEDLCFAFVDLESIMQDYEETWG